MEQGLKKRVKTEVQEMRSTALTELAKGRYCRGCSTTRDEARSLCFRYANVKRGVSTFRIDAYLAKNIGEYWSAYQ